MPCYTATARVFATAYPTANGSEESSQTKPTFSTARAVSAPGGDGAALSRLGRPASASVPALFGSLAAAVATCGTALRAACTATLAASRSFAGIASRGSRPFFLRPNSLGLV